MSKSSSFSISSFLSWKNDHPSVHSHLFKKDNPIRPPFNTISTTKSFHILQNPPLLLFLHTPIFCLLNLFFFNLASFSVIKMMDSSLLSLLTIDQLVLCKAALIFAITRWVFFCAQKFLTHYMYKYSVSMENDSEPSSANFSLEMAKEKLRLTSFTEIEGQGGSCCQKSCAVCLNRFKRKSDVYELCNCGHVFHRRCLERWLRYDAKMTCPLCRTPVIQLESEMSDILRHQPPPQPPSWAVERIVYLFGDDLLWSSTSCSSS